MFLKIHKSYRTVVALCDSDILGKKFEQDKFQLDVRENFYKGDEVSGEQAVFILKKQALEDATFNIVGKESVKTAIEAGIIKDSEVAYLNNIPFVLALI